MLATSYQIISFSFGFLFRLTWQYGAQSVGILLILNS